MNGEETQDRLVRANQEYGWLRLVRSSGIAALNDAITPAAGLVELVVVTHALRDDDADGGKAGLAAYALVTSLCAFVLNIFNWAVVVNVNVARNAPTARIRVAFVASASAGLLAACALVVARDLVLELYHSEQPVRNALGLFYGGRAVQLIPQLVFRTAIGILQGQQRLGSATALSCALSALLCLSNIISMVLLDKGLDGCAVGTVGVYCGMALLALLTVRRARTRDAMRVALLEGQQEARVQALCEDDEEYQGEQGGDEFRLADFMYHASNMMIRSFLLSFSLWIMAVFASQLGTDELAAHQVCVTLWTLTSYIVDGFADVAQMLGQRERDNLIVKRLVWRRLVVMALLCGCVFCLVFLLFQDGITRLFAKSTAVRACLNTVWPLLAIMQAVNSLVFVYDGIVYSTERFDLVRNIMLAGVLVWFLPALLVAQHYVRTLLALWVVKAVLNAHRAFWAIFLVERLFL